MKNRVVLRVLLYMDILLLIVLVLYKLYLVFFEKNFYALNLKSIEAVAKGAKGTNGFSFVVIGNIKNSIGIFDRKLVNRINLDRPDMVISVGNAVADGAEDKYRILYRSLRKLQGPVVLCIGDNEVSDKGKLRFYNHFGPFYFSFTLGDAYFIFLDTTGETFERWQRRWLIKTLRDSEKYRHRFVFMNKPPYEVKGAFLSDPEEKYVPDPQDRRFLIEAFSQYGVTAVFSSGLEIFESRSIGGVPYYITGGGGGGLILNDRRSFYHYIKVSVTPDGVAYDVVRLAKKPPSVFSKLLENLWVYVHSFFYISLMDFLLALSLIGLAGIVIFIRATKRVDYYPDFGARPSRVPANTRLRIAMFTNTYFPFVGGVPISIQRLAKGLRNLGHEVYVFAPEYPEKYPIEDDHTVRCKLLSYHDNYPVTNIFAPEIENRFASLNVDLVHVHHPYWMGSKGLKLASKYGVPVVFTYHTRLEKYSHYVPLMGVLFQNQVPHYIIRKFAQKCDAIFAPTRSAKAYLRNVGVSRYVSVLPTGVDFEFYENVEEREVEALRRTYAPNKEIVLLSVSRLAREKNLYFLLDGVRYIREHTEIDFKCVLVGSGPEEESILQSIEGGLLKGVVHLAGSLEQQEISKYYMFSDVFVFASQSETQGMVLLEAMAGGCPVVAVRSSGIEDVIRNGRNGFKTMADVRIWSEKVMGLMRNREALERMSEQAYAFSRKFSIEDMAEKAARVYLRLMRR